VILVGPVRFPHRFVDSLEYRLAQEHVHQIRIELRAPPRLDRLYSFAEAACVAVAAPVSDCVECVGDGHDARDERNSFRLQSARVSLAVPSFVVRGHSLGEVRKKSLERSQDLGAALGVCHHGAPLFRRELRRLVENVGERSVKLPDVVEECDALDAA
jgi:hypothetical protein